MLTKKKDVFTKMKDNETTAKELLQRGGKYKLPELKDILQYYQVKGHSSYNLSDAKTKLEKIIRGGKPAPVYVEWTDADEQKLLDLTTKPITLGDTALGRRQLVQKLELDATIRNMSMRERDELLEKIKNADERDVNETPASSVAILPNLGGTSTVSTAATDLFSEAMIDDDDIGMKQAAI